MKKNALLILILIVAGAAAYAWFTQYREVHQQNETGKISPLVSLIEHMEDSGFVGSADIQFQSMSSSDASPLGLTAVLDELQVEGFGYVPSISTVLIPDARMSACISGSKEHPPTLVFDRPQTRLTSQRSARVVIMLDHRCRIVEVEAVNQPNDAF